MTHMAYGYSIDEWCCYTRQTALFRLVDQNNIWSKIIYRIWLNGENTVIHARAHDLFLLDSVQP